MRIPLSTKYCSLLIFVPASRGAGKDLVPGWWSVPVARWAGKCFDTRTLSSRAACSGSQGKMTLGDLNKMK
eukprot:1613255-Rhodomonas_salina.1